MNDTFLKYGHVFDHSDCEFDIPETREESISYCYTKCLNCKVKAANAWDDENEEFIEYISFLELDGEEPLMTCNEYVIKNIIE